MTATHAIDGGQAPEGASGEPGRLISRPMLVRFVSIAGTATSFYAGS